MPPLVVRLVPGLVVRLVLLVLVVELALVDLAPASAGYAVKVTVAPVNVTAIAAMANVLAIVFMVALPCCDIRNIDAAG